MTKLSPSSGSAAGTIFLHRLLLNRWYPFLSPGITGGRARQVLETSRILVYSIQIRSRRGVPSARGGLDELQYVSFFSSFPSLILVIRDLYFSLHAVHNIRVVLCMSEYRDPS